jgi:predicted kinase
LGGSITVQSWLDRERDVARLIVLAGLPAVGKSTIARELARRIGAVWLRVDSMDQAIWASGTAPGDLRDWTYRAAQAVASDNLALGRDVIADCVNDYAGARDGWDACGRAVGVEVTWLEIVCGDPAEHRRRTETRTSDVPGLELPDWRAVTERDYQPWDRQRLIIDTAHRSVEACVEVALRAVAPNPTARGSGSGG